MKWTTIEQMSAMAPLPDGYRYERLKRSGIPPLIEAIQVGHPDIAVGGAVVIYAKLCPQLIKR